MTKRFSRIGWVVIALALVLAALGSVAPLPASAAPSPQGVTPGTVVTLAGTPHIWIADDQGVLHWNGDTRALATQFVNWGSRLTMSLGQLQGMRRGDRWLSAGLLKDGDPIYLVKWESNESVPRLLHIQSIRDVEQFGIKRSNHGSFVIDRMAWEQQFGISASSLPRGVLTSAVQRPSVVALTDAWEENGLVLSINGTPHGCCWSWGDPDLVALSFTLENKTSSTLNFEVPLRSFSIQLSTGKKYVGSHPYEPSNKPVVFNDFRPGSRRSFAVPFRIGLNEFNALKRDPTVSSYTVGVSGFNSRLPEAQFREQVEH